MSADDPTEPDMVVMYLHHGDSKERFTEPLTYEAAIERAKRMEGEGYDVPALITIEHASERKAVQRLGLDVDEVHRLIKDELERQVATKAAQTRALLLDAVTSGDSAAIRSEAQQWSGYVAATLLEIASRIEAIKEAGES